MPGMTRVLDLHSEIRVASSGELTVTERITLQAAVAMPPLERELPAGSRVVEVMRNGQPEPYEVEGRRLRVRAPASAGRHLYRITYRSLRQVRFLEAHDELRWSAGSAERLTAEVVLPAAVPARSIHADATGREWQSFVRDGRAAFRARESLAIRVRFPKDVVAAPQLGERARWFAADYLGLLLVAAGLCLTAAVLLQLKKTSARP